MTTLHCCGKLAMYYRIIKVDLGEKTFQSKKIYTCGLHKKDGDKVLEEFTFSYTCSIGVK